MLVSIIIPTFNEKNNIETIIDRIIERVNISKQIIIVDDCSTDGTREILKKKLEFKVDKIIYHDKNLGKGGAIRSSLPFIKGEIVAIQDADLEYDPYDLNKLIEAIINKKTNIAYGSRVLSKKKRYDIDSFTSKFRIFGNHFLTEVSNITNNQKLTDAHTCYKVFRTYIFKKLKIEENGFSFCPEVNTKIAKLNEEIIEMPITYRGRSISEGKKIRLKDAFHALYVIFKYKIKKLTP